MIFVAAVLSIGLGAGVPVTDDQISYENPYNAHIQYTLDNGINVWGEAEKGKFKSKLENKESYKFDVGVGYTYKFWQDRLFVGAGVGYSWVSLDNSGEFIQVPLDGSYALVDVKKDWTGRVGGGFNLGEHFTFSAYYKYFKPETSQYTFDVVEKDFIHINEKIDMSTYNFTVSYNF